MGDEMKYVVDTCVINKLVDGAIKPENLPTDGKLIATHIQSDELNKTRDTDRRDQLLLRFEITIEVVVPTESVICGVSRVGHCKVGDARVYEKIRDELDTINRKKPNNVMDALIAEVAIQNGYTLLTTDYDLKCVAELNGCRVVYWRP